MVDQKISSKKSLSDLGVVTSQSGRNDSITNKLVKKRYAILALVTLAVGLIIVLSFAKGNSAPCEKTFAQAKQYNKANKYQQAYEALDVYAQECTKVDQKSSTDTKIKALDYSFLLTTSAFRSGNTEFAKKYSITTLGIYQKLTIKERVRVHDTVGLVFDLSDIKDGYYLKRRGL